MELALGRHNDGPEFARVNKRLKDKDGRPIGISADNPILYTGMYKVEYSDGYKTVMTANAIAHNLFAQVNQDGQRLYYSTPSYIHVPMAQRSRRGMPLSICTIETRGGEIPPKDGNFESNGKMVSQLRTKLRTSRSPSCCN